MDSSGKSILTVALDAETVERIAPILGRDGLAVERVQNAEEALTSARRSRHDLVICRYPLPDMKLRDFVAVVRDGTSASRNCSLMMLTIPEMTTEARQGAAGGPFMVFSSQEPLGSLGEGAAQLLQVAPRHAPRIRTRLSVSFAPDEQPVEGWVVNLSATGMLVTEIPMLPVGSSCGFEVKLPGGERIRGRAEVVRHAKPRRERVTGFALRFLSFEDDGRAALIAWCQGDRE
jgi:CheY-like chemotaxis protein